MERSFRNSLQLLHNLDSTPSPLQLSGKSALSIQGSAQRKSTLRFQSEKGDMCLHIIRYVLVMTNILFLFTGFAMVSLSVWFHAVPANWNVYTVATTTTTLEYVQMCAWVIMISGICTAFVSVVGCCGAFSSSKYILGVFFLTLILLFVMLISMASFGFLLQTKIAAGLEYQLSSSFIRSYRGDDANNTESLAWRHIQSDLHCCGVRSAMDYEFLDVGLMDPSGAALNLKGVEFWRGNRTEKLWPPSCCVLRRDHQFLANKYVDLNACRRQRMTENGVKSRHWEGCYRKVEAFLMNGISIMTVLAIVLAVAQLVIFCTIRRLEAALIDVDEASTFTAFSTHTLAKSLRSHSRIRQISPTESLSATGPFKIEDVP